MEELMTYLHGHFYTHIVLVSLSLSGIIVGMVIDLITGIRKAKENGEATTSKGLKKTCDKAQKYLLPFFILVWIDLLASVFCKAPYFAMAWSAYCIYCEWRSVLEKSWEKADLRKAEKTMNIVVENKKEIAKLVAELVKELANDKDNTEGVAQ